jgi:hypothetical protein
MGCNQPPGAGPHPGATGSDPAAALRFSCVSAEPVAADGKEQKAEWCVTPYHEAGDGMMHSINLDLSRLHFELEALNGLLHSIRLALGAAPLAVAADEGGADARAPAPVPAEFLCAYV